ncbi:photosynthetic complex assembly protein PuhC [Polynucleobacter sp. IMCC30063]|uniref:photosynthetic complex assembly protein PuhC n=1 Tax=Polynucleobacter sp. IMCC30063 TaxID=2907298 RepID=UPI001EEE8E16|nr:photosynthetic complex assembly protein PuhC [Polynucleobacter sp. IMCC30063]MCE7505102.1 photosynthetic complex assembly protein PuhC [Polynucleobacter sp. IMCC30063]
MRLTLEPKLIPRGMGIAVISVMLLTFTWVAMVSLQGHDIGEPYAPTQQVRQLRFEDRADGSIAVIEFISGQQIHSVVGESGFVRGVLRGLAQERKREGFDSSRPFELIGHTDGRLTLIDPVTKRKVDLDSFGPTNAENFLRMLTKPVKEQK